MRSTFIVNHEHLQHLDQSATSNRTRQWVRTVLYNHLVRELEYWTIPALRQDPGAAGNLLEVEPRLLLSARDAATAGSAMAFNQKPFEVIDPWSQPSVWEHYQMGCACVTVVITENTRNQVHHICEALDALYPTGDLSRVSVVQAQQAATEWTTRLWRAQVAGGGQTQNTFTFVHEDQTWGVFQLLDRAAYEAEGSALHHCVATYWGRDCVIYSLRKRKIVVESEGPVETWERCATIEVRDNRVVQIRGDHNRRPDLPVLEALDCWTQHAGIQGEARAPLIAGYAGHLDGFTFLRGNAPTMLGANIANSNIAVRPPQNFVAEFAAIDNCELTMGHGGSMPRVQITGTLTPQGLEALRNALALIRR